MKKLAFAAAAAAAFSCAGSAVAEDLDFLLVNQSSSALVSFHVSPASRNSWEENLLQGGILDSNYEIDVIIADGLSTCVYDIRADFEDGDTLEDYGLDLCELGSYTFE